MVEESFQRSGRQPLSTKGLFVHELVDLDGEGSHLFHVQALAARGAPNSAEFGWISMRET